jgi:hypothetical protein
MTKYYRVYFDDDNGAEKSEVVIALSPKDAIKQLLNRGCFQSIDDPSLMAGRCHPTGEQFSVNDYLLYQKIEAMEKCLIEIQQMCIGEIAMGIKLEAETIGEMIYEKTGVKQ